MGNSRDKNLYAKTKYTITGWFNNRYKRLLQRQRVKFGCDLPFDRWDLENWVLKEQYDIFMQLFKNWQNNNYEADSVPSIDRIDCLQPYAFSNMQIITWKENKEKYNELERPKYNLKICEQMVKQTRKAVKQINRDGTIKNYFISISEAARQTKIDSSTICECCQGKRKSAKGYRWCYA